MEEDVGLPLREAAEHYTDRGVWQAYLNASERAQQYRPPSRGLNVWVRGGGPYGLSPWQQERDRAIAARKAAWREVVSDLRKRLILGELIAWGMECPLQMNREPQRVPPHLLPSLKFDFQTSSFEGHGLSIVDVRIRRAVTTQSGPAVEGGPAALEGTPPELSDHVTVSIPPPGKPGRPQLPADFEQELRRHFEAGEMANTFGQELRYLYAWGKSRRLKTSKGDPWALSTIGNNLRTIYRELKARKTHPD